MSNSSNSQKPRVDIIVDARQFDDDTFQKAADELLPYFALSGGPTIKLSEQPPLVIAITLMLSTFGAVAINLISSVLYDWLKKWATHSAHKENVIIVFKVFDGKDFVKSARITMPSSDESLKEALTAISEFLEGTEQLHRPTKARKTRKNTD